jgi:hypothetical protein
MFLEAARGSSSPTRLPRIQLSKSLFVLSQARNPVWCHVVFPVVKMSPT